MVNITQLNNAIKGKSAPSGGLNVPEIKALLKKYGVAIPSRAVRNTLNQLLKSNKAKIIAGIKRTKDAAPVQVQAQRAAPSKPFGRRGAAAMALPDMFFETVETLTPRQLVERCMTSKSFKNTCTKYAKQDNTFLIKLLAGILDRPGFVNPRSPMYLSPENITKYYITKFSKKIDIDGNTIETFSKRRGWRNKVGSVAGYIGDLTDGEIPERYIERLICELVNPIKLLKMVGAPHFHGNTDCIAQIRTTGFYPNVRKYIISVLRKIEIERPVPTPPLTAEELEEDRAEDERFEYIRMRAENIRERDRLENIRMRAERAAAGLPPQRFYHLKKSTSKSTR